MRNQSSIRFETEAMGNWEMAYLHENLKINNNMLITMLFTKKAKRNVTEILS